MSQCINGYTVYCQESGTDEPIIFAGQEEGPDIEYRQVDPEGRGAGMNRETRIDMYTLPCIRMTGCSAWCSVMT